MVLERPLFSGVRGRIILRTSPRQSSRRSGRVGRYRRRGYGYSLGASCKRSRRSITVAKQGSFWETLIGGTGEGPEAERKEKVLQYINHRLKGKPPYERYSERSMCAATAASPR